MIRKNTACKLMILGLCFLFLTGCMGTKPEVSEGDQAKSAPDIVTITTGNLGGFSHVFGTATAKVWAENANVEAAVQSSGGFAENLGLLATEQADFGFVDSPSIAMAVKGLDRYAGKEEEYGRLRAIYSFPYAQFQLAVLNNSPFKAIKDLKGKRIAIGAPGSAGATVYWPVVLDEHGVTKENSKYEMLEAKASNEMVIDGSIAGRTTLGLMPVASITNLAVERSIRILSMEMDAMERVIERLPGLYVTEADASVYPDVGNTEPVATLGFDAVFLTREDIDDNLVYRATKAFWENISELQQSHASASVVELETALNNIVVPLHPGAEKYYREVGVIK